ncbi:MAG TPA: LapA family protein [Gemmataceae bacterium]
MRTVYLILFVLFVAAVIVFIVQNNEPSTIRFFGASATASQALIVVVSYVLGMLSGWSVYGFLRRSFSRATEPRYRH